MGKPLMPWQRYVVDVALEIQSEAAGDPAPGEWAYDEVVVTVQRQAGKTVLVRPVLVHRCGSLPQARTWMTAQTGKHARKRWMDATDVLVSSYLGSKVKRKTGIGHEELRWLSTQSTLEPFAPNSDSLHGETPDLVIVDELWAFDAEEAEELQQAYLPGFTTKDGQAWLLSTAGNAGSAWLNAARLQGRESVAAGARLGTAYFEWGVPDEVDGVKVEDLSKEAVLELVLAHHPADGHTLRPASVASAQGKMSQAEFLRAYGNHTDDSSGRPRLVEPRVIARTLTRDEIPVGAITGLAFDVDPELRQSAISAAWRDEHGRALSAVIASAPGSRWLAAEVAGIVERNTIPLVGVNDAGPARDVADSLERGGLKLLRVNLPDYRAACNRWYDDLHATIDVPGEDDPSPLLRHDGDASLVESIGSAIWQTSGQSRVFRSAGAPIPALTSNALALWAFDHIDPEPDLGPFTIR